MGGGGWGGREKASEREVRRLLVATLPGEWAARSISKGLAQAGVHVIVIILGIRQREKERAWGAEGVGVSLGRGSGVSLASLRSLLTAPDTEPPHHHTALRADGIRLLIAALCAQHSSGFVLAVCVCVSVCMCVWCV